MKTRYTRVFIDGDNQVRRGDREAGRVVDRDHGNGEWLLRARVQAATTVLQFHIDGHLAVGVRPQGISQGTVGRHLRLDNEQIVRAGAEDEGQILVFIGSTGADVSGPFDDLVKTRYTRVFIDRDNQVRRGDREAGCVVDYIDHNLDGADVVPISVNNAEGESVGSIEVQVRHIGNVGTVCVGFTRIAQIVKDTGQHTVVGLCLDNKSEFARFKVSSGKGDAEWCILISRYFLA